MKQGDLGKLRRLRELRAQTAERLARQARTQADEAKRAFLGRKRELDSVNTALNSVMQRALGEPQLDAMARADLTDSIALGKVQFSQAVDSVRQAARVANAKENDAIAAHQAQTDARNALERWDKLVEHIEKSRSWAEENAAEYAQEIDYVIVSNSSG